MVVDGEETDLPCADCPPTNRYGLGTCTDCDRRVSQRFLDVDGKGRPIHASITTTGVVCHGIVELDQDAELPRHMRAAMAPGQDRIPIGGGEW